MIVRYLDPLEDELRANDADLLEEFTSGSSRMSESDSESSVVSEPPEKKNAAHSPKQELAASRKAKPAEVDVQSAPSNACPYPLLPYVIPRGFRA